MMFRQIVQLQGTVTNTNLPDRDVTDAEIAVAQLADIAVWPAMASWGLTDEATGLLDRLTDTARLANGAQAIGARFALGGTPSLEGYTLNAVNQAIIAPLDTSKGFTIGIVARSGLALGSFSTPANTWWVIHDNLDTSPTKGKLRLSVGGITSVFADYAGPPLTPTDWHYIVLVVDKTAGTIRLRHNGVEVLLRSGMAPAANILAEFGIGIYNTGSQAIRAAFYRSPIAFSRPLSVAEILTVEAMLLEKTLG
ncbi:hypothetical protein D3C85_899640 [compost metagenome]